MSSINTELVGILNITPDSFSDGGLYNDRNKALIRANELFNTGASYLDVGAESTRPGAVTLTSEEEWSRLKPVLSELVFAHPDHISVDTYKPETVRRVAREIGQFILNDVTCFNNPQMIELAASLNLRCIVSHLPQAYDQDIQNAHKDSKKMDSIDEVTDELMHKRDQMINSGVRSGMIILDPGIGFGKTKKLNWQLLSFAKQVPGIDVMIGYSRKRFLGKQRMDIQTNLQAAKVAIDAGAKYLRVHDVKEHKELLSTLETKANCQTQNP
jgi:dihydropteroate synthase